MIREGRHSGCGSSVLTDLAERVLLRHMYIALYHIIQYSTVQCSTVQYTTEHCSALPRRACAPSHRACARPRRGKEVAHARREATERAQERGGRGGAVAAVAISRVRARCGQRRGQSGRRVREEGGTVSACFVRSARPRRQPAGFARTKETPSHLEEVGDVFHLLEGHARLLDLAHL